MLPRNLAQLRSNANAATLAALALVLLSIGMFMPVITMKVSLAGIDNTLSLIGGISELFQQGSWALAVLLLIFSVIFPTAKLVLLLVATNGAVPLSARARVTLHHWVSLTAKYSMLDIFVVAIMVVVVKLRDMATVSARPGTYIFCGAILLSIVAGYAVDLAALEGIDRDSPRIDS